MSDEPRDVTETGGQPDEQGGADRPGSAGPAAADSSHVPSAPWERPRRWNQDALDATRVDDLLARLGTGDDVPSGRRRRRQADSPEGSAVSASDLIAALSADEGQDTTGSPRLVRRTTGRPPHHRGSDRRHYLASLGGIHPVGSRSPDCSGPCARRSDPGNHSHPITRSTDGSGNHCGSPAPRTDLHTGADAHTGRCDHRPAGGPVSHRRPQAAAGRPMTPSCCRRGSGRATGLRSAISATTRGPTTSPR